MSFGVTLVVPCYNEADRLPVEELSSYLAAHSDVRLVLVNDGSTDRTLDVLRGLERRHPPQTIVLDLQPNRGKAEAVRQGLQRALDGGSPLVGFWDADLATPLDALAEFRALLAQRPDVDWVIGARVQLLGRFIERHAWRHYLGRLFATGASLTLGVAVYDTQCGAKLFRATPLLAETIRQPFASRWVFDVELIGRYLRRLAAQKVPRPEQRIFEYPLMTWIDVTGSKVKAFDFVRAIVELIRIRVRLRREGR